MMRATQQALSIPAFRAPADCTPQVLGGLWPAELQRVTDETASVAKYLNSDLQRIANSANKKLRAISEAGLIEPVRRAEEARVINVARAFAVLRVESTVRHLRKEPLGFQPEYLNLGAAPDGPTMAVTPAEEPARAGSPVYQPPSQPAARRDEAPCDPQERAKADDVVDMGDLDDAADREPDVSTPGTPCPAMRPASALSASGDRVGVPTRPRESDEHRLRRLVQYVARQEPGLKWAVGQREDGTTVLVTDLAHGWIPSGVDLPAGVVLVEPGRRSGSAAALLGSTALSAAYTPGDPFGNATQFDVTTTSSAIRRAEPVEDLGWQLTEATHWRDGLPRMVNTMAKAGATGTGVVDAELDVLRVHLDTARYQLLASYPDIEPSVLLNCLLLAATEAIVRGDRTAANYHFAWFRALTAPPSSSWSARA